VPKFYVSYVSMSLRLSNMCVPIPASSPILVISTETYSNAGTCWCHCAVDCALLCQKLEIPVLQISCIVAFGALKHVRTYPGIVVQC
jgi:hypothetical protein